MKAFLFSAFFYSFSLILFSQDSGNKSSRSTEDEILFLEQNIIHLEQQLLLERTEILRAGFKGVHKQQEKTSLLISQVRSEIQQRKTVETERRLKYAYEIKQNLSYVSKSDSLILIALYDSSDGDNWVHNDNWKNTPVNLWYGISVGDSSITSIKLNENNLSGNFPGGLGSLLKLDTIDLSSNLLEGSIPSELGNLSRLSVLSLAYNQLTGSIPPELGNLSSLAGLLLYHNQLSGAIPLEIGNLPELIHLYLHHNELDGAIPPELGNLSSLEFLVLSFNQLSDTIPPELGNLPKLESLFLSSNQLEGEIPAELGNLTSLENLSLPSNQLSGTIPAELGDLSNLNYLDMASNQLSGSIPSELKRLSNLSYLSLSSNQLSGVIPPELGGLSELNYLYLSDNQLEDTIPPEVGKLSGLNYLYLSGNQLRGNVPHELGELSALISLSLIDNQFEGMLPSGIADLSNLTSLYINNNRFTGLPDLSSLQLDYLWIDNNFFTFEDLEPNMHVASVEMRYEQQGHVGEEISQEVPIGIMATLVASVGGNYNHYQWLKNDIELVSATDSIFYIEAFSIADTGTYTCKVVNDSVPGLIIETSPVNLREEAGFTVSFTVSDGDDPINGAVVSFDAYGQITTDTNGLASFTDVIREPDIPYTISATGYDTLNGSLTVTDKDTSIHITMLVTGIQNRQSEKISVYPNPVHDILHISSDKYFFIEIFDITGKYILSEKNKHEINLSGLKEGIYFLRLKSKNNIPIKTFRIVKR